MKNRIAFLVFGVLLLGLIYCNNNKAKPLAANTAKQAHQSKTREQLIAECAGCHPQEYKNEMIGPHANSFTMMKNYVDDAGVNPDFPKDYAAYVQTNYKQLCATCHTGENIYENSLAISLNNSNVDELVKLHEGKIHEYAQARKDTVSWKTGVDCLTCHQAGENVITTQTAGLNKSAACQPVGNALYATNYNCISCHHFANNTMANNIHNASLTKDMNCLGCHMEYKNDKPTHYMYWRHDPPEKKQALVRSGLFDDFIATIKNAGNGKSMLNIEWANKRAPHGVSECGELIVAVQVTDAHKKVLLNDTVRVNNKEYLDKGIAHFFTTGQVPGKVGYTLMPDTAAYKKTLAFNTPATGGLKVSVKAFEKAQYWVGDKVAKLVYERSNQF